MAAKAKAKAKRRKEITKVMSAKEQKAFERKVKTTLDDFDELADKRYAYATKILQHNDDKVRETVEHMVETMRHMAGPPRFKVDGVFVNVEPEILERINKKLHTWIAVRLLVAAAEWDIRISGLKLPKKSCARCGKKAK